MKKKNFAFLALSVLLAGCAAFSAFNAPAVVAEEKKEKISTYQQINTYDTVQDVMECNYAAMFGKADINTDKQYITQGEGSARLEVWGSFFAGTTYPYMEIRLNGNDVLDLSRLKNVQFDMFNAAGEKSYVEVALSIGEKTTNFQKIDLAEGKNEVKIAYNVKGMAGGYDMTQGKKLLLRFPKKTNAEEAKTNVFYLDNVGLGMTLKAPKAYEMTFDEGEFCSFDKNYQEFITNVGGVSTGDSYPILSVNKDKAYSMNCEGKSLKVECQPQITAGGAVYFYLMEDIWHKFDFETLGAEDKYFTFDIYNDTRTDENMNIQIWRKRGDSVVAGNYNRYVYRYTAKAGQWTTVRISIKEWVTPGMPAYNDEYVLMGYDKDLGLYNYGAPMFFVPKSDQLKVFYFDNFRIENKENA
ncbi:MAG: hypothetical protein IJX87_00915 [Clostridia bacterium]|nr:hypothetical protein [Clostridia bacterium]